MRGNTRKSGPPGRLGSLRPLCKGRSKRGRRAAEQRQVPLPQVALHRLQVEVRRRARAGAARVLLSTRPRQAQFKVAQQPAATLARDDCCGSAAGPLLWC